MKYASESYDEAEIGDAKNNYRVDFESYAYELLEDETLMSVGKINRLGVC